MGFLSSLFRNFTNFVGGGAQPQQTAAQAAAPATRSGGLMGTFNNHPVASGLGLMGASQLFGGHTKLPSFNTPEVDALKNFNVNNFQQINPEMEAAINRSMAIQQEQEMRNLRDVYKNLRPGTDYTTDSAYQRDLANLQRNQTMNRSDAMAGAQAQFNGQQLQANQQHLAQLGSSADTSVNEIMARAGLKSQQQQQFKDLLSGVGGQFVNKGLFPDAYKNPLMGLFK